jgi:hypothetical protein
MIDCSISTREQRPNLTGDLEILSRLHDEHGRSRIPT